MGDDTTWSPRGSIWLECDVLVLLPSDETRRLAREARNAVTALLQSPGVTGSMSYQPEGD